MTWNRDFALLWGGQAVSNLGSAIAMTSTPLLVRTTTGSPAEPGLVGEAGSMPHLLASLPAGALADRWDRRRILLISEVVAGLTLLTLPLAIWCGLLTVLQIGVVSFVQGLCFVFFGVAERAALPKVVAAADLPSAIARNEARARGAALAGPPNGGVLFGVDRALPFLVDGLSYLIAAGFLVFLRRDLRDASAAPPEPLWRSAAVGLRWIWRYPLVRAAMVLIAVSNLVFGALILALVVLAQRQGAGPAGIGLMLGIYSVGGLAGALAASRLHRYATPKQIIVGVNWVWAALLPLFLLAEGPLWIGAIGAASAFVGPLWNVMILTLATVLVPDDLLGRVMSAGMMLSFGIAPVASLGAGFLLAAVGPLPTIGILAAVMLAAAVTATASPAIRCAPPLPVGAGV